MDNNKNASSLSDTAQPVPMLTSNKGVINLSNHVLTDSELSVLSRGLNFCPTPTSWDFSDVMDGLDRLHRRMRFFKKTLSPPILTRIKVSLTRNSDLNPLLTPWTDMFGNFHN